MPTDDKMEQLKEMRERRDGKPPTPAPAAAAAPATPEPPRNPDGTFAAKPDTVATPAPAPEPPPAPPAAAAPPTAPAQPSTVEIDVDGTKIAVDPALAAAFQRAESARVDATKVNERAALVADVVEAVKPLLPPPPAAKTAAELAAERALLDATAPKKPDAKLLIEDPAKWQEQQDAYEEHRVQRALEARDARAADAARTQTATIAAQQERDARDTLREQFYRAYPVFRASADLVNGMLETKFDEVIASGKLNKPLSPTEREALKDAEFADVAARATRSIVKVMQAGKQVVPPPPPPALVSSAPARPAAPPTPEAPKRPTEKYPQGSVSRILAERKASREGTARA